MSLASKLTLAGTSLFAVSTILFVHYAQNAEKAVMSPKHPLPRSDRYTHSIKPQNFMIQS